MRELDAFINVGQAFVAGFVPGFSAVWQDCAKDAWNLRKQRHLLENPVKILNSLFLAGCLPVNRHLWILYSSWI